MVAREPIPPAAEDAQKPAQQRPETPEFWDHRFRQGVTPWDAGRVPQQFADFSRQHHRHLAAKRALVPGCGSAYEAGHLDAQGWTTDALDFSAAAIETARATLPVFGGRLLHADFFDFVHDAPYQLVYERAFLCALPRKLWPAYAPRMAELLEPGGLLAGYFFIDENALKGPPFGIAAALLENFCKPYFELVDDQATPDAIGPFVGKERWMVWRRK